MDRLHPRRGWRRRYGVAASLLARIPHNDGTTAPTRERKPGHDYFPINSQANAAIPAIHVRPPRSFHARCSVPQVARCREDLLRAVLPSPRRPGHSWGQRSHHVIHGDLPMYSPPDPKIPGSLPRRTLRPASSTTRGYWECNLSSRSLSVNYLFTNFLPSRIKTPL